MADDKSGDDNKSGDDANEAQWQALEERTKKATRAAMDEWWEERKTEAKKNNAGIDISFGPLGSLLGFKAGTTADKK